ncbi:hypothetical protein BG015_009077 [Linnemannia schmuckeri]|uniref:ADP-ribosylation factor n=1 Tax=Linnemannia schmuckeri TaxID=64567 RepID=A0A9P5RWF1_9FUNG|nr:hypothetical protein BG015_009077 [Linnemannia schmuckeri]
MGMTLSNYRLPSHNCHRDRKILLLGLDSSGKTSILYRLHLDSFGGFIPTIGFNVENIRPPFCKEHLVLWDISGQSIQLWRHYFLHNEALVFVVDSTDYARIREAKEALWRVLQHQDMAETRFLLVYANKQDRPNAMTVREVMEALDIENLVKTATPTTGAAGAAGRRRRWHVQGSSALLGDGLWKGIEWLCAQIKDRSMNTSVATPSTSNKG